MPSLHAGYEYDVFISYRQNDNRSGWVSAFVANLRGELSSVFKEPINIYFDENPHDGLKGTHQVDKSLEGKLKCLIFVPILSRTYCDPKSFAWEQEFIVFRDRARDDGMGLLVRLENRNVASRILPVQIHELDPRDRSLFERESGGALRSIEFIFTSQGVNRPLTADDGRADNQRKTFYRDQINQAAHAIGEILSSVAASQQDAPAPPDTGASRGNEAAATVSKPAWVWSELLRRNVFRVAVAFIVVVSAIRQSLVLLTPKFQIEEGTIDMVVWIMIGLFPFAIAFAWVYEKSPEGWIKTTDPQSATNPYRPSKKKPFTGTVIIGLLVILLMGQYLYFSLKNSGLENLSNLQKSIAVLPFENRSENKNDEYLADGLTEDIINQLSVIGSLRVVSRGAIQKYKGQGSTYSNIASELQVTTLLTGSVVRNGDAVRVTAQLIEGSTSSYLWGNTFHRRTSDVNAVQAEIAQIIAGVLKVKLNDFEMQRLGKTPTESATAYDYYLRGRSLYYLYQRDANDQAVEQFKMAINLDPRYVRAWAGLGDAYSQMHNRYGLDVNWIDSSIVAGTRAVELDSNSSEAYKALANAYNYKDQYDKAFPLLQKAVRLNPNNEQAIGNLGTNYLLRTDLPNALLWEKKAVGMNPKNWIPYQLIGWIYRLLGDLDQAESWLLRSSELNPKVWDTYELLAYTYVAKGHHEKALKLIPRVLEIGSTDPRALEIAGLIAHFAGDKKSAKEYFQRSIDNNPSYRNDPTTTSNIGLGQILLEEGKKVDADVYLSHAFDLRMREIQGGSQSPDSPYCIAAIHAIQGNKKQSLLWLQKAIDAKWLDHAQVIYGPWFSQFRSDPEFVEKISAVRKKTDAMRKLAETK